MEREEQLRESVIKSPPSKPPTGEEAENADTDWLDLIGEAKLKEVSQETKEILARKLTKEKHAFYEKIKEHLSDSNKKQSATKLGAQSTNTEVKPLAGQPLTDQRHETHSTEKLIVAEES